MSAGGLAALRRRYPTASAFLDALERFQPGDTVRAHPSGNTWCACCPGCRSRALGATAGWLRFPLVVCENAAGWNLAPMCGCSPRGILRALLEVDHAKVEGELAALAREAA